MSSSDDTLGDARALPLEKLLRASIREATAAVSVEDEAVEAARAEFGEGVVEALRRIGYDPAGPGELEVETELELSLSQGGDSAEVGSEEGAEAYGVSVSLVSLSKYDFDLEGASRVRAVLRSRPPRVTKP